ncbi:hypothetical protein EBT16_09745 [bacterium]|nr:hypothetical protein [bacterium]
MRGPKNQKDPLQQLFEHHLLNRSYDDAGAFSKEVAKEYLGYIDATLAHVPIHLRASILEDLQTETHEMLIKKMYGVENLPESTNFGKVILVEPKNKSLKPIQIYLAPTPESNPDSSEER